MSEESYRIVELSSENFKRLKAVRIRPDGSLVIIAGDNKQGKSCVLDSIEATLGGEKHIPPEPVRKGKRRGRTTVNLGELVAERTYGPNAKLVVKDAEDTPQNGPQTILKDLWNELTFDPMAFVRMKPQKQDEVLKQLLGLDFGKLDAQRAGAYAKRTDLNRDAKRIEAQLDAAEHHADVPEEEVSVAELMDELERRRAELRMNADVRRKAQSQATCASSLGYKAEEIRRQIAKYQEQLTAVEEEEECEKQESARLAAQVARLVDPDVDEVRQQIAQADDVNRRVRENAERRKLADALEQLEQQTKTLTDQIAEIDDEKQAMIADAKFPIEGLGFGDVGVTLDGVPFEQAATSDQIRASVAVGAALHPKLRVLLIRDGNDLDETRLKLLAEMAEELDLQIWIERIAGGPGAVVIEDGEVREESEEAKKAADGADEESAARHD